MHRRGLQPTFHVEAHDYPTAVAFVGAGIGITVLPALGAAHLPDGVTAVPVVRPTVVRSIYAVVRDAAAQTPPARVTLDALVAVAHAVRREREASTGAAAAPGAPAVAPRRLDGHRRRPSAVGSPTK